MRTPLLILAVAALALALAFVLESPGSAEPTYPVARTFPLGVSTAGSGDLVAVAACPAVTSVVAADTSRRGFSVQNVGAAGTSALCKRTQGVAVSTTSYSYALEAHPSGAGHGGAPVAIDGWQGAFSCCCLAGACVVAFDAIPTN